MKRKGILIKFFTFSFFFILSASLVSQEQKQKEVKKDGTRVLLEEIVITAKVPAQQPISTVSSLSSKKLKKTVSKNLSEVISLLPGVYVSEGHKGNANINIRGLSSKRITLMVDGIPIYEPYFNSFDLKSFSSSCVDKIKVIKGSSSVLYGPNTLGGVVNVITQRPQKKFFSFNGNYSENSSWFLSGTGAIQLKKISVITNVNWDKSDGFDWKDGKGTRIREWSEYDKRNMSVKFFYSPNDKSEIIGGIFYTNSEYKIPPAIDYFKKRYWHFKDWDRFRINLGALFSLGERGFVKVKTYYVHHYNVLDDYKNSQMEVLHWEDTYKNFSLGFSGIAEYSLNSDNLLKLSLNSGFNRVNIQSDIGEEWVRYNRNIYSIALEDHFRIAKKLSLIGGLSIDFLYKNNREMVSTLSPIIGLKYILGQYANIFVSYARKSRFPSMKSLYSRRSGNPDLIEEIGNSVELGFSYNNLFSFSGAVFFNVFDDMIQSYRGLDGFRNYQNIGKAEIRGFELEFGKKFEAFDFTLSYTFLDSLEIGLNIPLDYTPKHQFNFFLSTVSLEGFTLNIWGSAVSENFAKMGKKPPFKSIQIPGYFILNLMLEKSFNNFSIYLKITNALNAVYLTEPGFPAYDRRIMTGVRLNFE
jgi:iron complex outermembrane receptor protein